MLYCGECVIYHKGSRTFLLSMADLLSFAHVRLRKGLAKEAARNKEGTHMSILSVDVVHSHDSSGTQ